MLQRNNVYNMDCRDGLRQLPDSSVDFCCTSPPYKDSDGYTDILMFDVFTQLYRVLKPNSLFFLNFGHLAGNKLRPFKVCQIACTVGFRLNDTITWTKTQYRPLQGNKRLNNLTEFIFLLYKGEMPDLDRKAIGIEHKDKSNVKRWGRNWKCRGNSWVIGYETIQSKSEKLHNDRYPLELPTLCLKLSGLKQGIAVEPFCGSGTGCLAAKNLGIDYIGFEISSEYCNIARQRLCLT